MITSAVLLALFRQSFMSISVEKEFVCLEVGRFMTERTQEALVLAWCLAPQPLITIPARGTFWSLVWRSAPNTFGVALLLFLYRAARSEARPDL